MGLASRSPSRPTTGRSRARTATWRRALWSSLFLLAAPQAVHAAEGLNLFPSFPALVGQFVVLLVLIPIVHNLLLKPVTAVLAEREKQTQGSTDVAGDLTDEAARLADEMEARLLQARTDAQQARASVLAEAERTERGILDTAREQAAEAVEKVRAAVQADFEQARASLESDARQLAREAAGKLLGRAL